MIPNPPKPDVAVVEHSDSNSATTSKRRGRDTLMSYSDRGIWRRLSRNSKTFGAVNYGTSGFGQKQKPTPKRSKKHRRRQGPVAPDDRNLMWDEAAQRMVLRESSAMAHQHKRLRARWFNGDCAACGAQQIWVFRPQYALGQRYATMCRDCYSYYAQLRQGEKAERQIVHADPEQWTASQRELLGLFEFDDWDPGFQEELKKRQ